MDVQVGGCGDHCWAAIAGCHCWVPLPLLGAIAGDRGWVGVHVGGLDVAPLLAAIAGLPLLCHCRLPLLGMGGGVGGLDVVTLLGAVAGCHCWAAIAGRHCWG